MSNAVDSADVQSPTPVWLREPWPVLLGIGVVAAILLIFDASPLTRFERLWTDFLLRLRFQMGAAGKPDSNIFLVGLEKNDLVGVSSVAAEYETYAEIIQIASDLKASVVTLDLVMARGDPVGAGPVIAAARRNGRVVLAEVIGGATPLRSFMFAPPEFPSGAIDVKDDPDGVFRHYHYGYSRSGSCVPSLALAAYLMWQDARADLTCRDSATLVWKELGPDKRSLQEHTLSLRSYRLNFRSGFSVPWDRGFKYASVDDLRSKYKLWKASGAQAEVPGLPSKGSLLLVGANAPGVGDAGPTPFGQIEPLFELHATALNDLIQNKLLTEAPGLWNAVWAVSALLAFTLLCRRTRTILALFGLCAVMILLTLIISGLALLQQNLVLAAVTPAAFLSLGLLAESGRRSALTSLQKMRLRTTLGRYFSPRVLEDVLRNPDVMKPREAEITVLLTDLRNFTTITERLGTQRMFDLLNDVFEIETGAVLGLDGSMEHFVGDQFLAYWGAPRDQPDAPDRAMQASAIIIRQLDALHASLPPDVIDLFGYGLAIHRGKALIGNKGSRLRLDYGILGDIVNGAARVESLTKLYGVRQIITREVLDCLANKPHCRLLDRVRVKGKSEPLELYEVLTTSLPERLALRDCYEKAWMLYERGDFPQALGAFAGLKETDRASQLLWKRCAELMAASPSSWDGAYQLEEK